MTFIKKILPAMVLLSLTLMVLVPLSVSADQVGGIESPNESLCTEVKHELGHLVKDCTPGEIKAEMKNSHICCLLDLMETIIDYAFVILLIFAAMMLIWGAYMFVSAGGNTDKINAARDRLIWALVGVAVAIAAKGLVRVIENLLS
jgi:hypothetical protein